MPRPELSSIDQLPDFPIQPVIIDGHPSPLILEFLKTIENGQVSYQIGEENPLQLSLRLGAYIKKHPEMPGLKNSVWSFEKRVWEPEVIPALKRKIKNPVEFPTNQRHDIDDFVVVPEGAEIGFYVEGRGEIDRLLSLRGWSERGSLDINRGQRYVVEDGKKVIKGYKGRSRDGIAIYGSIKEFNPDPTEGIPSKDIPLRSRQTYGRFGRGDRLILPMHKPFILHETGRGFEEPDLLALAQFSRGETFYPNESNFPHYIPIQMGKFPKVIKLDVFEGREDWIQEEENLVKGFEIPHIDHDPNSTTERCPGCGNTGMSEDDFYFEQYTLDISQRKFRFKSSRKIAQIRLALVTPEYTKLDFKGKVANSCQSCFPAPCHNMHKAVETWTHCRDCQKDHCLKHSFYEHTFVCNDHSEEFRNQLKERQKMEDEMRAERNKFVEKY